MLQAILLAASLLAAPQTSTVCVDMGGKIASTETQPVHGPAGDTAGLKVTSSDDYSKNSHLCNADYQLVVKPAGAAAPSVVDLLASDGDYGRRITLRLAGFSLDGKHVFGVLSEGGKTPSTLLFDYNTANGNAQLEDLEALLARAAARKCIEKIAVIGTIEAGAVALELESSAECGAKRRWRLDPASNRVRSLPQAAPVLGLYKRQANSN
jgi:hypothetical protein